MDRPTNPPTDPDETNPQPIDSAATPPAVEPSGERMDEDVDVWKRPDAAVVPFPGEPAPPVEPARRDNRLGRWARVFLRGLLIFLVLVGAGMLAAYFLWIAPLNGRLRQTGDELQAAQTQVADQEAEVNQTRQENERLTGTNQELSDTVELTEAHVLLLQAMQDVAQARYYLAVEDSASAKVALKDTPARLEQIADLAAGYDTFLPQATQDRLALVLDEIDRDPKTAGADLTTLDTQLADLEKLMFLE